MQEPQGEGFTRQIDRRTQFLVNNVADYSTIRVPPTEHLPINALIHIPKSELQGNKRKGNEDWYKSAVEEALILNKQVFGLLPQNIHVIFLSTTDEYNELTGEKVKVKGDNLQGFATSTEIVFFTPAALTLETDAKTLTDETDLVKEGVKHETAHFVIDNLHDVTKRVNYPDWINEGIPMLVPQNLTENVDFDSDWIKGMYKALKDSPYMPPTDEYLNNTPLPGRRTKVRNAFGQQFLRWLVKRTSPSESELEQKLLLSKILDNGFVMERFNLEVAMKKTFNIKYFDAYQQFMKYLETNLGN